MYGRILTPHNGESTTNQGMKMARIKSGLSYHLAFSMVTAKRTVRHAIYKKTQQDLITQQGHLLSNEDALKGIEGMKKRGFEVLPMCDHYDDKGFCLGHKE